MEKPISLISGIVVAVTALFNLAGADRLPKFNKYDVSHLNLTSGRFPQGFAWSVGTSAYQVEGGWNVDGKGESFWDRICHSGFCNKETGDVACDSYRRYAEDVKIIKELNLKHYRFSLSWSRILPKGTIDEINQDGLAYYKNFVDMLLGNGIQPQVTIYHWDLPMALQNKGGYLSPDFPDWFANYSTVCFKELGDKVKFWFTINEMFNVATQVARWTNMLYPGSLDDSVSRYAVGHNLLKAHAKAYHIYDNQFRQSQKGKISFITDAYMYFPASEKPEDIEAAERFMQFSFGWFTHPVYSTSGDYPQVMKDYIKKRSLAEGRNVSRLPEFTPEEVNSIRGTYDFFAFNSYTSFAVRQRKDANDMGESLKTSTHRLQNDADAILVPAEGARQTTAGWLWIAPKGLRGVCNWIKKEFGQQQHLDIYVTENGVCDDGGDPMNDIVRIEYLLSYTNQLMKAITDDGINVKGYGFWSLMDNFEWLDGTKTKFGLYSVNFSDPSRPRTIKESGKVYKKLVTDNGFIADTKPASDTAPDSTPGLIPSSAETICSISKLISLFGLIVVFINL